MFFVALLAAALAAQPSPPVPRESASGDSSAFALDTRPVTSGFGTSPAFPLDTLPANDVWTIH